MNNYQQSQVNNPEIAKPDIFTLKSILNPGGKYDSRIEVELRLDSDKDHQQ
jgi:hypothetical protein